VVNVHARGAFFDLNRGNLTREPFRVPFFDFDQLPNPTAKFASPDAYASLLFSRHHGATSSFTAFHALRSEYADQFTDGVRSPSGMR
jgi:hypothetical protein